MACGQALGLGGSRCRGVEVVGGQIGEGGGPEHLGDRPHPGDRPGVGERRGRDTGQGAADGVRHVVRGGGDESRVPEEHGAHPARRGQGGRGGRDHRGPSSGRERDGHPGQRLPEVSGPCHEGVCSGVGVAVGAHGRILPSGDVGLLLIFRDGARVVHRGIRGHRPIPPARPAGSVLPQGHEPAAAPTAY